MTLIVRRRARVVDRLNLDDSGAMEIARRSQGARGGPLLRRVRDFTNVAKMKIGVSQRPPTTLQRLDVDDLASMPWIGATCA
ncbi:MAG: hypothetical protein R3D05_04830 [Dongiaceae bacterium]